MIDWWLASLSFSLRPHVEPGEDDGSEERGGQSADRRNRTSIQTEQSQASSSLFLNRCSDHILLTRTWMKDNCAHCVTSFPSGDSRQRFWEGEREEPGDGGNSRRQRAGHQHQEHPHRHRLRGHTLPRDPGMEFKAFFKISGKLQDFKSLGHFTHGFCDTTSPKVLLKHKGLSCEVKTWSGKM